MLSGKLIHAVVNSSGLLVRRLASVWRGNGKNLSITVPRPVGNEDEPRTADVRLTDVRTANSLWRGMPEQMLHYAGVRIAAFAIYSEKEFDAPAPPWAKWPT